LTPSAPGEHPQLDFTVSTDVKNQVDLLRASADTDGRGGSPVKMEFRHALSAITVRTGDAMLAGKITNVTLSGIRGKGTLTLADGKWTATGGNVTYSVATEEDVSGASADDNYASTSLNIAGEKNGLTFFMIPQELTSEAKLSITFTDNLTKTERTLNASIGGNGKKWESGKLYSYSISSTGVIVTPVVELSRTDGSALPDSIPYTGVLRDVTMNAYVKVTQSGKETCYLRPDYKIYSVAGENNWSEEDWKTATWTEVTGMVDSDDKTLTLPTEDITKSVSGSLILIPQPEFLNMRKPMKYSEADVKGSADSPIDLSGGGETANCYLIDSPGYYSLPLVYGNGRDASGAENKSAFTITAEEHDPGLLYFVDHENNRIETSDIKAHLSAACGSVPEEAFILWQDSPGLIDNVALDSTNGRITFHVSRHTLSQGNAVIALRDSKGDIVWNWHIWATHYDWENPIHITEGQYQDKNGVTQTEEYIFSPSVLGYCDARGAAPKREIRMKVEFNLKGVNGIKYTAYNLTDKNRDKTRTANFFQQEIIASLAGDNTYYQWGRKDPMVPGIYDKPDYLYYPGIPDRKDIFTMLNKPIYDFRDEYRFTVSPETNGVSFGYTVKYPYRFIMGIDRRSSNSDSYKLNHRAHWHNGEGQTYMDESENTLMYNVWDSSAVCRGAETSYPTWKNNQSVTKTIYDPSPRGYNVPPAVAFTGMIGPGGYSSDKAYPDNPVTFDYARRKWNFTMKKDGSGLPAPVYATGMRDMNLNNSQLPSQPAAVKGTTWAAYSMITFITTTTMGATAQCLIFYIDNRNGNNNFTGILDGSGKVCGSCTGSNNSYGFTVWPVRSK
ncbi:MAG: fimbrillin family protein, partial [Muribaculaceae bacterium]|nr:fimbrillin family protein [Muribaculaceae bacterium]